MYYSPSMVKGGSPPDLHRVLWSHQAFVPYASTISSKTHRGTNLDSSSSSSSSFFFAPSALPQASPPLRRRITLPHIILVLVELTLVYLGSPSRNIVLNGHIPPRRRGPHEFSICSFRSSGPSASHVRIPLKKRDAFCVLAYLQMYPVTTFTCFRRDYGQTKEEGDSYVRFFIFSRGCMYVITKKNGHHIRISRDVSRGTRNHRSFRGVQSSRTLDLHVVAARRISPIPPIVAFRVATPDEHLTKYPRTRLRRDVVPFIWIHPYATNDASVSACIMQSVFHRGFDMRRNDTVS
jgi:hypothetical protein